MKFRVERTRMSDDKPCDGAYESDYIRVDEWEVDDPFKLKSSYYCYGEKWYKQGKNHRVEDGHIKRDLDDHGWFIDIESLEELVKLMERVGENIIIMNDEGILAIEIYDNYRE